MSLEWLGEDVIPNTTLFILGSGETIEAISEQEWAEVGTNFSVGMNAWPLHPFVPDVLAFEPFDEASTDYLQLFEKVLFEDRFRLNSPKILLFRPNLKRDGDRYLLIPQRLKSDARLYGRYSPSTRNLRTLKQEVASLRALQSRDFIADSLTLDSGASVIRLVALGMRLGFTKIVLLGVDLNGGQYFWEKNPRRLEERGLYSFSPGFVRPIHETMTRVQKPFILTEVLSVLQEIVCRAGGSLFAGSSKSLLSEILPVYEWSCHDKLIAPN